MEDDSIFHYKMAYNGEYNDETKQKTIVFNDKRFNIEWPVQSPILSTRDRNGN
jgi:dTDP-4-dehydrorhamnose 3,5-epimerase